MKRKGVSQALTGIVLLGVIAGVVVFTGGFSTLSITSNLCVDSIDEITISSNVLDFNGDDAFSISGVSGNCDNYIMGGGGTIPAEDIAAQGLQATRDFTVGVTSMQQYMYHEVQNFKNPVFRPRHRYLQPDDVRDIIGSCSGVFGVCTDSDFYEACQSWQGETSSSSILDVPGSESQVDNYQFNRNGVETMFCSRSEKVGVNSAYGIDSFSDFTATITALSGGTSAKGTISKDDSVANIQIGDVNGDGDSEHVKVTWLGSLLTELRTADFHNDFRPVFACTSQDCGDPSEISWQVSSEQQYINYVEGIQNYPDNVAQEISNGGDGGDTASSFRNTVNLLLDSDEQALLNQLGSWAGRVETRQGETRVYAVDGRNVENPEFRFLIDSEWVAAAVPVAKPSITDAPSSLTIEGGSQTQFQVSVRNTASTSGTVQIGGTCDNSLVGIDSSTIQIGSGETRTVTLTADASQSNSDVDVTCEIFAQDTDDSSTVDTTTATVTVLSSCSDADGDGVCNQFDQCDNQAGSASNSGCPVKEVCGDGIDNDGDGSIDEGCKDGDGGGLFPGLNFKNPFTDLIAGITSGDTNGKPGALFYLDLFLSFVAGTAVFGFARSMLADAAGIMQTRRRIVFGLVVGVMGAFVAYQFVSMLVVKILLVAGVIVYAYLKSLIPGI